MLKFLVSALYRLGVFQLFLWAERKWGWRRCAICLCYHSVRLSLPAHPISMMEEGTQATVFQRQLASLNKWFDFADDRWLADWMDGKASATSDRLIVTFDDGYKDNDEVARPILQRLKAPAIVFIATDYIESENRFWWIRLSEAMRHISTSAWRLLLEADLPQPIKQIVAAETLESWESRRRARLGIAKEIDGSPAAEEVLATLESKIDGRPDCSMPLMSWNDINRLQNDGFRFGGHTHSHPRLSLLDRKPIQHELETCWKVLTGRLNNDVVSFAYPAGDYDQRVVDELKRQPFRIAFTTRPGVIHQNSSRFELPRIGLARQSETELCCAAAVIAAAKYLPSRFADRAIRLACCGSQ